MTSSSVYNQFRTAFAHIQAYALLKDGEVKARVAVQHSKTTGNVYVYLRAFGGVFKGKGSPGRSGTTEAIRAAANVAANNEAYQGDDLRRILAFDPPGVIDWKQAVEKAGYIVIEAL